MDNKMTEEITQQLNYHLHAKNIFADVSNVASTETGSTGRAHQMTLTAGASLTTKHG